MNNIWREVELGEVLTLKRGYDLPERDRKRGSVPVVSSSGISGYHDEAKADGPGVVTGRYGTLGQFYYIPDDYWPHNTSLYVQDFKSNNRRYAYYLLSSLSVASKSAVSAVPGLNRNDLHRIKVRQAPKDIQERIADILGSLDDKIDGNRQMNRTLEAMAQALYRQWFVDFGPFQDGAFVDSEVGKVPAGWRVGSVLEHCDLLSGGTPKTKTEEYWNGDIPWVSAKDIGDGEVYVTDTERKVTPLGVQNSATKILPAHTVVVVARGSVGKFGMMAREMAMNQSCYGLRGRDGVGQPWVYLMLSDLIRHLRQVAYGSVFDTITTSTFKSAQIVLPPREVLDGFDQEAAPFFAQIHANAMESIALAETRDYLLPRLLSGEVEVGAAAEIA